MNVEEAQGQTKAIEEVEAQGQAEPIPKKKPAKRWTWSKAKDMPKRHLTGYNIFFKYTQLRVINGISEEDTEENMIACIEAIIQDCSRKKRRRERKKHGMISLKNLTKVVSKKWKNIDERQKAIFERYAEMERDKYFTKVKIWKAKKEAEMINAYHGINRSDDNDSKHSWSSASLDDSDRSYSSWLTDTQKSLSSAAELDVSEKSYASYLTNTKAKSSGDERRHLDSGDRGDLEEPLELKPRSLPRTIVGDSSINRTETETGNEEFRELKKRYKAVTEELDSAYLELYAAVLFDSKKNENREGESGGRFKSCDDDENKNRSNPSSEIPIDAVEPRGRRLESCTDGPIDDEAISGEGLDDVDIDLDFARFHEI